MDYSDLDVRHVQTTGGSELRMFAGDHFFFHSAQAEVQHALRSGLEAALSELR